MKTFRSAEYIIALCLLVLIFSVTFLSCGLGIRTRAFLGGKLLIRVTISEHANENSSVPVDLIVGYDEKLMERLLGLSSKQWYEQREQIKRDYIEGKDLDCWEWEWVPGQRIPDQELPLKPSAVGAIIFAGYLTPGVHRVRTDPFEDIVIHLSEKDFSAESVQTPD